MGIINYFYSLLTSFIAFKEHIAPSNKKIKKQANSF